MSFPTFIPLLNNSPVFNSGFTSCISVIVDATDNPTSITAPSDDIKIPANSKSPIFIFVQFATDTRLSILLTLYPDMPDILPKSHAAIPDIITPDIVPKIAARDFLV